MKRALVGALALALLVPIGVVATDDPQIVCTRVEMPAGHVLEGTPFVRGEPADGGCGTIVYLPLVVTDAAAVSQLVTMAQEQAAMAEEQAAMAEEQAARAAAAELMADESCERLLERLVKLEGGLGPTLDAAYGEYAERCMTCDELAEDLERLSEGSVVGDMAAMAYEERCE